MYTGIYVCLTPIVLVDLMGLEKLSNAFGLVLLFQGIGAVPGSPFAGLFKCGSNSCSDCCPKLNLFNPATKWRSSLRLVAPTGCGDYIATGRRKQA